MRADRRLRRRPRSISAGSRKPGSAYEITIMLARRRRGPLGRGGERVPQGRRVAVPAATFDYRRRRGRFRAARPPADARRTAARD